VRRYVPSHVVRGGVADAGELAAVLHLADGLHDSHVTVLGVGDLEELGVYAAQALVVGLVEEALEKDVLLSLAGDQELVPHRPRLTSASR
jgi:hypothetical protein